MCIGGGGGSAPPPATVVEDKPTVEETKQTETKAANDRIAKDQANRKMKRRTKGNDIRVEERWYGNNGTGLSLNGNGPSGSDLGPSGGGSGGMGSGTDNTTGGGAGGSGGQGFA